MGNTDLIKDDTVLVAFDVSGGMCDRLMLGKKGLIYNANSSIEVLNDGVDDTEKIDLITTDTIDDLDRAINTLTTDCFSVFFVTDKTIVFDNMIVGKDIINVKFNNGITVVDVNKVEFDENGIYNIK